MSWANTLYLRWVIFFVMVSTRKEYLLPRYRGVYPHNDFQFDGQDILLKQSTGRHRSRCDVVPLFHLCCCICLVYNFGSLVTLSRRSCPMSHLQVRFHRWDEVGSTAPNLKLGPIQSQRCRMSAFTQSRYVTWFSLEEIGLDLANLSFTDGFSKNTSRPLGWKSQTHCQILGCPGEVSIFHTDPVTVQWGPQGGDCFAADTWLLF